MLTPHEIAVLDRMVFAAAGAASPDSSGSRASRARGFGLEFRDFRHYRPGDDPRHIDWTIQARLQQLVVRQFRADGQLRVHLIVDTSQSISVGMPDKLSCVRKLASLLSYVATRHGDALGLANFDTTVRAVLPPSAGRTQWRRVLDRLGSVESAGPSATNQALMDYSSMIAGPGLAVVISDFFDEHGAFEGLQYLAHRGLACAVIQVVAPDELDPDLEAEVELVDVERPGARGIVVDSRVVDRYKTRLAHQANEFAEFCAAHDMVWMRVVSSMTFTELLRACIDARLLATQG